MDRAFISGSLFVPLPHPSYPLSLPPALADLLPSGCPLLQHLDLSRTAASPVGWTRGIALLLGPEVRREERGREGGREEEREEK